MLKCIGKFEIWVMEGNAFLPLPDEKNNRLFVNEEDFRKMLAACNNDHDNKQTNRILGTGRKPTREREYGKVVRALRKDGKTIREIAEYVGISTSTVQKILKAQQDKKGS